MKLQQNELVSIITPSYNSARFISESINSVINQTYANWEMIIVDDFSSDNSVEVIKDYLRKDNRIRLYELDRNEGAAQARNKALEKAKGRYIAFLDSDDIWNSNKLEVQLNFMQQNRCPIVFSSYDVYNEEIVTKAYTVSVPKVINYNQYLKNTIIGMSTSVIDKKIVGNFKFYNIRTRQDTYLWITLLKKGFSAYGIDIPLAKYRVRSQSISANKLKAVSKVWFLYYKLEGFSFFKSLYLLIFYAYNAIKKRKKS